MDYEKISCSFMERLLPRMTNLSLLSVNYMYLSCIPLLPSRLKTLVFENFDSNDESALFQSISSSTNIKILNMTLQSSNFNLRSRLTHLLVKESNIESLTICFNEGTEYDIEELLLYIKDKHIKLRRLYIKFGKLMRYNQEFIDNVCTKILNRMVFLNHIHIYDTVDVPMIIQLRRNKGRI